MKNTTKKYSKEDAPTYAYTVLSHLVSHGDMKFAKMRDLLGIGHNGFWYKHLLKYIFNEIENLKKEWDESIPLITVLVFDQHRNSSKPVCELLTGNRNEQPTPQQIKEVRESVAAYDKWDKVLEAFRLLATDA